ncbi:MAG: hypothetical protein AABZ44_01740 [Elusimicrobiota bacterium]
MDEPEKLSWPKKIGLGLLIYYVAAGIIAAIITLCMFMFDLGKSLHFGV